MIAEDDLQTALDLLDRRFGLDTLWLFGSEAQGNARADSDIDLAALFRRRPSGLEIIDTQGDLAEILHRDVDLVDLDQASPILGMQVLRHGRLLIDRNPRRRLAFFSRTISMYEDVQILRWMAKASPEEIQPTARESWTPSESQTAAPDRRFRSHSPDFGSRSPPFR